MARLTENGLVIDGILDIRERLNERANINFKDLLNGNELQTDDSTVLGRIFGTVAETLQSYEECIQQGVSLLDPNQVSGDTLDDFVYLSAMMRGNSEPATAFILLFGEIGGSTGNNASVRSPITGDVFNLPKVINFKSEDSNGIEFELVNPTAEQTQYTITYQVSDNESINTPITILSYENETLESIALRLSQTINQQTSDLYASVTKNNNVNVYIKNRNKIADWNCNSNLVMKYSYMPSETQSATYTAITQKAFTLTQISSGASSNWKSVTNPYPSSASRPIENDSQLKYRWRQEKMGTAFGEYDTLKYKLDSILGVTFTNIQQNIAQKSNGDRINKGVAIIVQGGDQQVIAQTIFDHLATGTATSGQITRYATAIDGSSFEVKFSRPEFLDIKISFALKALPDFPTNGKSMIKQAIIDYFNTLDVGEDILYSRLFEPINTIRGFSVRNLQIGTVGGVMDTRDLLVKYNQLATINPDNILIGGS